MSGGLEAWLDAAEAGLVDDLVARLGARAGSVFRARGAAATREAATRTIAGLRRDATAGGQAGLRAALDHVFAGELAFADVKLLATATREAILAAAPVAEAAALEAWSFQLALHASQRLVAERERSFQEQAAKLEVHRLEQQIGELTEANAEKTRLLERIREASTPIVPIHDGILVVPLIGMFDSQRAALLTERLLDGVAAARAEVVIVDVSGVPLFDADAAQLVVRNAAAVRLLGATMILVGLSPAVARAIVASGVDLAGLTTLGTLQAGLGHALGLRRLRIVGA